MAGGVRVAAGQQQGAVGEVRTRGPRLAAVDDPLVAVALRRRWSSAARSEPAFGFAEQQAPRRAAGEDRRDQFRRPARPSRARRSSAAPRPSPSRPAARARRARRSRGATAAASSADAPTAHDGGQRRRRPAAAAEAIPPRADVERPDPSARRATRPARRSARPPEQATRSDRRQATRTPTAHDASGSAPGWCAVAGSRG